MMNNKFQYGRGFVNSQETEMLHRAGKKFAGSHTTIIEETAMLVDFSEKMPEVTKIVLGPIKNMKNLKISIKFFEIGAGWKAVICGKTARQEIFLYTANRAMVLENIYKKFPEIRPIIPQNKKK